MKKKIIILTQPLGLNYGGIIQNYALQYTLIKLGFNPLTLDRQKNRNGTWLGFKMKLYNFLHQKNSSEIPARIRKFASQHNNEFIRRHILITEEIKSDDSVTKFFNKNKFDFYIVGSDQTWRPHYSPNIYNYFLDFLKGQKAGNKCIAYASSFGTDKWEYSINATEKVKHLIKQFDAVSVREDSGISLCKNYLDTHAEHVLDPTLLLYADDYINDLNLTDSVENKNVFTYVLDKNKHKQDFIEKCANELGLPVKSSQAEKDIYKYQIGDNKNNYLQPPIEEWLSGFRNAEFVITDSFHGMVFSIIFGKPFIAIVNRERGASRFTSLLTQLNLLDRLVYDVAEIPINLLNKSIDYEKVNFKLQRLREKSTDFLKRNLC